MDKNHQTEILQLFIEALRTFHGTGCCVHIVVDDMNVEDDNVDFCIEWAKDAGHGSCQAIAEALRRLTRKERCALLDPYNIYFDKDGVEL